MQAHIAVNAQPNQPEHNQTVSYDGVTMPVAVGIAAFGAIAVTLFGIAWRLSTEKGRIDRNAEKIAELEKDVQKYRELEQSERKTIKAELETHITNALERSQSTVVNELKLLAQRMEMGMKFLAEGQVARNNTLNKLVNRQDALARTQLEIEGKLNSMNIPFTNRYRDGDVPSRPGDPYA